MRPGFSGPKSARAFQIAGLRGEVLSGKAALEEVPDACARADFVVVPSALGVAAPVPGCLIIDRTLLDQSGALALHPVQGGVRLDPVRQVARIWLGERPVLPEMFLALADLRVSSCGSDQPACPGP
jgi:competence protein ComEC